MVSKGKFEARIRELVAGQAMLERIVEPLLRPVRRVLPPIGGLDLSALVVILLLQAAMIALPSVP